MRSFWEVLKAMPLEQKKAFLTFATGSDRCAQRNPKMSLHSAAHDAHDAQELSLSIPMNPTGRKAFGGCEVLAPSRIFCPAIAFICGRCAQCHCSPRAFVARKA